MQFNYLTINNTFDILSKLGGLAERLKAAVLKTVDAQASAGSNPVSSARIKAPFQALFQYGFLISPQHEIAFGDEESGDQGKEKIDDGLMEDDDFQSVASDEIDGAIPVISVKEGKKCSSILVYNGSYGCAKHEFTDMGEQRKIIPAAEINRIFCKHWMKKSKQIVFGQIISREICHVVIYNKGYYGNDKAGCRGRISVTENEVDNCPHKNA